MALPNLQTVEFPLRQERKPIVGYTIIRVKDNRSPGIAVMVVSYAAPGVIGPGAFAPTGVLKTATDLIPLLPSRDLASTLGWHLPTELQGLCPDPFSGSKNRRLLGMDDDAVPGGKKRQRPSYAVRCREFVGLGNVFYANGKVGRLVAISHAGHSQNCTYACAQYFREHLG